MKWSLNDTAKCKSRSVYNKLGHLPEGIREDGETQAAFRGDTQSFTTCMRHWGQHTSQMKRCMQSLSHEAAGYSGETKFSVAIAAGEAQDRSQSL